MNIEHLIATLKGRGFIFQDSEIYGGVAGIYDFGPLGVELKNNIKKLWWKKFVHQRSDVVGIETAVIMNPRVWQASGHVTEFFDLLIECKQCHQRFRKDFIKRGACPNCGGKEWTEEKKFNIMFKTSIGPVEDSSSIAYLRPETAQGMFVNFKNVLETNRLALPFGIAQIGKSFRNEITIGNYIFRLREFEISEVEYFVKPKQADRAFKEWLDFMMIVLMKDFKISKEHLKFNEKDSHERAHYSKRTIDIMYKFPWGWDELWAIANRTDYDLKRHAEFSGKNLKYFDIETKEEYYPYVIEPTGGVERLLLAILCEKYQEVAGGRTTTTQATKEKEVVLRLPFALSPIQVAVFPLLGNNEKLSRLAEHIHLDLKTDFNAQFDDSGSIGRRYRRQDEIGTPFCITIDHQSLEDKTVTIRDRDTMKQERIKISALKDALKEKLEK